MAEYHLSYESELDTFQLYYRYNEPPKEDWRTAALRGPALPALGNALAGAMGSAVSNVATYPLSVIVARLQTRRQNRANKSDNNEKENEDEDEEEDTSIISAAKELYQKGGLKAFYPGLAQDTAKTVADNFLFFLAYSFFRQRRTRARFGAQRARIHTSIVLPVLDELAIGILAGSFSKLFTTPLANIVTRKQTAASSKKAREIAAQIRSEKGLKGFWSGYSATLILTLNPSITFFLNEVLKYTLLQGEKRSKPSPATTFLLAALSKAAASSITYPFSMAKTRAQVSGNASVSNKKATNEKTLLILLTPQILRNVVSIARREGPTALYSGLPGEVLKGFFSHGFTMLAKDAVYSLIVKSYYLLLLVLRKYPTPEELIERARERMEEYAEVAHEGAKDFAEKAKNGAEDIAEKAKNGAEVILESQPGHVAVDASSYVTPGGIESSSALPNETADLLGDYVGGDE
ncbi:putative mitochondrial carrier protein [Aspergillus chevalieri]|uniref:Mitochondrial carrier protein n=1 Tax=Aspergillus chevalieri TaxID=182096 RepID=A0A7R7VS11_ASPCH|nr:uncharacterized protein ACHE_50955S [Aspergillus chevalieri]BCR89757.1 hypothetical protein ACHE_50955S [Aspergillus chevalieri]